MEEKALKLSIIIPVYNGAETLQECVNSIVAANLLWEYEILLINDGSTDGSDALCYELQQQWQDRIRYIYKDNGGSLSARLRGVQEAKGEYLLYVDCDDVLLAEELNKALQSITQPDADLYLFDYLFEHPQTGELRCQKVLEGHITNQVFVGAERKPLMDAYMAGSLNTMVCTLIRRNVAQETLVLEKEKKMIVGEDRLQKMYVMIHAHCIEYIPVSVYRYINRPNSQSAPLYAAHIAKPMVLLKDFANCWRYETMQADKLMQSDPEKLAMDHSRLRRTYKLLADVQADPLHTKQTKRELFAAVCDEETVVDIICRVQCGKKKDRHGHIVADILKRKKYWQFVLYNKLLQRMRTLKHGRK